MTYTQNGQRLFQQRANPQARMRLFCFPYAGGRDLIFRGWQEELPSFVEVCPVELPGRGRRLREAPFTRLTALVEDLGRDIVPYLDKPFAFFGHSMGAMISFELAQLLRREQGMTPAHLFVSGRRAPHVPEQSPTTYNLPEPEFLEELRRLNGTPREVLEHAELIQLTLPLLRADFEVVQTYDYKPLPPLSCPLTAFGGLQDVEVRREYLEAWRECTTGPFTLRMMPGDHFFLHTTRRLLLQVLAQQLQQTAVSLGRV
jgi:medium-chain acyl-[acyl-carrier-protein] hydrolase